MSTTPVLELVGVNASYGPFKALFDVSIKVGSGESVAIIGANGSGKTSVARVASGLVAPSSGSVFIDGVDMTNARTYKFARAGVYHAPEGRSVFSTLTVEENIILASGASKLNRSTLMDEAFTLFPKLAERRGQLAGTMSGGEQRMLALAGVIMSKPRLFIGDELSLGLAPMIVEDVYRALADIKKMGTSLLIIEQHVSHALNISDQAVLMDHGSVQWTGPVNEAYDKIENQLFKTN